jgi:hypothetical protein
MMDFEAWRQRRLEASRAASLAREAGGPRFFERVRRWVAALAYDGGGHEDGRVEKRCRREVRSRRVSRRTRRKCVDTQAALAKFEAQVKNQVVLAGGDEAVEAASRALMASLGPAARQLAWNLAEQAAVEVDAQLPHNKVEVTLREGEPVLNVRESEENVRAPGGEYEARITLRLPTDLKETIESAARTAGDSVNSYLVKDISRTVSRTGRGGAGKSFKGRVKS